MADPPAPFLLPSLRGRSLFSSEALQRVYAETVAPEVDDTHSLVMAGTFTPAGAQAAVVFSRPVTVLGKAGVWQVQGAWLHRWTGEDEREGKILFKL